MPRVVRAEWDPRLSARVVSRRPLFYSDGPDPREDRPAHVRAGSGVTFFDGCLAVVQDDANFLALVDPTTWKVASVALPAAPDGSRQFGDDRGNKAKKLDLEACVTLTLDGAVTLVAFGSGSTPARERLAVVRVTSAGTRDARLVDAPALYAALRTCRQFSGSELNLEGVVVAGERIWFVQRGNGEARDGFVPANATASLPMSAVLALISGDPGARIPELEDVMTYDLGAVGGVPLTFTDATRAPSATSDRDLAMVYLAAAEASPDATRDGPVVGAAVGVVSGARARSAILTNREGVALSDKTEGIVLDPDDEGRAWVVIDADDASKPCDLCEVRLDGPWW